MNRWSIVRLDYLFSVVIPCLVAIYVNDLPLLDHVKTIFGWVFLGIAGNVINDMVDKDRDHGWHPKEMAAVALGSIVLGVLCFADTFARDPASIAWVGLAVVLILLYSFKLKQVPVASALVQVLAELLLPYLTIHVPAGPLEWTWVGALYSFGVLSQLVHESIDNEAITRFSPRTIRRILISLALLTMGLGAVIFLSGPLWLGAAPEWNILPFAFVPAAVIYIYRVPRSSPAPNIKNVGLILGNLFMAYFLLLVVAG